MAHDARWLVRYAVFCLAVFTAVFVLNQADRQVLSVVIPGGMGCGNGVNGTSQADCINITDYQQGIVTGPAFTVVFVLAGLPISHLADSLSRRSILVTGLVFWSAMMVLMYTITEFWQLLILRMSLGIGEATCNPTVISMLGDLFVPERRAMALSAYNYGVYVGGGIGYLEGIVNDAVGWRWAFVSLGLPGFLLAVIIITTIREPRRGQTEHVASSMYTADDHVAVYGTKAALGMLFSNRTFVLMCIASSIRMLSGYALGGWMATFYQRQYSLDSSQYGTALGLIVMVGGVAGCSIGGYLSDALMHTSPAAKVYVITVSQLLSAPLIAGVFLAPTPAASYTLLFFAYVTGETWLGPASAVVLDIVPASMRARATAVYTVINTLTGGQGPLVIGALIGDSGLCTRAYGEIEGVKYALLYMMPTCYVLSAAVFYLAARSLTRHQYTLIDEAEADSK